MNPENGDSEISASTQPITLLFFSNTRFGAYFSNPENEVSEWSSCWVILKRDFSLYISYGEFFSEKLET